MRMIILITEVDLRHFEKLQRFLVFKFARTSGKLSLVSGIKLFLFDS